MLDTLSNIIHLLTTAVWLGGAFFIHFVLQPSIKMIDPQQSGKLMSIISKRFSITAWICILLLVVTGIFKTPSDMYFDISSDFGLILTIKHILILMVIIGGLIIAFAIVPELRKNSPVPGQAPSEEFIKQQKKLSNVATINLVLGIIIVVCASALW